MSKKIKELITGIVYCQFDDVLGPNPITAFPEVDQSVQMLIAIKVTTLLAGEETYTPKDATIVPFPSQKSKGMVYYLSWEDSERRGGIGRSSITILFKEFDDLIFYKYRDDLKPLFIESSEKIKDIEVNGGDQQLISSAIQEFYQNVLNLLKTLKEKEMMAQKEDAFPEAEEQGEFDYRFKIIIAGDPAVGKTSTVLRFTRNAFTRTYLPTIGTNISEKTLHFDNKRFQLIIWDVAGQSKFSTMRQHCYKGADAVVFIFDLTHPESFNSIPEWYTDIQKSIGNQRLHGFLIGNKNDLKEEREVNSEMAQNMASKLGLTYFETSALTGENIDRMFSELTKTILNSKNQPKN